jgi:hypothetical protein
MYWLIFGISHSHHLIVVVEITKFHLGINTMVFDFQYQCNTRYWLDNRF